MHRHKNTERVWDMERIHLTKLINANILQQIQDGFSKYTGMAALTADEEGVPVTQGSGFTSFCTNLTRKSEVGSKRCEACDRDGALKSLRAGKPSVYYCHAGLIDYAAPIMLNGKVIGSFIGGQVRTSELDEEKMRRKALEMDIDPEVYIQAAQETLVLPQEEVERAAEFLAKIAEVLSEMAYHNYLAIQESRKMEQAARSQSDFIMHLSMRMKKNMKEWMSSVEDRIRQENGQISDGMRTLLLQGAEVYSMVEDAVEYIKMSEGKVELRENSYGIRELIEQTVAGVRSYFCNDSVAIEIQIEDNVPENMLGDAGRIGQIINKLLVNSVNATKEGRITIKVSCQKHSYATMLKISVEDTGVGMNEKQLHEIQEYMQSDTNLALKRDDGHELGLSIVKLLLRQMSGKIEVVSKQDEGTVFTFVLPQLEVKGGTAYGI